MKYQHYIASGAIAIALATSGIVSSSASNFDFNQYFGVRDQFFFGSQNVIFNYNNGFTQVTPYNVGDYFFFYTLPFDADLGFFHYSYQDGRYVEAVYLNDYPL